VGLFPSQVLRLACVVPSSSPVRSEDMDIKFILVTMNGQKMYFNCNTGEIISPEAYHLILVNEKFWKVLRS